MILEQREFVNAHQHGVAGDRMPAARSIEPWLLKNLDGYVRGPENLQATTRRASTVLHELLVNVSEHAGSRFTSESLSQVILLSVDRVPHLQVRVTDDGPGIPATLRPKVPAMPEDEVGLLMTLFTQDVTWGRARGLGMQEIRKGARGGTLRAETGSQVVVLTDRGCVITPRTSSRPGTIMTVEFPLPGGIRSW